MPIDNSQQPGLINRLIASVLPGPQNFLTNPQAALSQSHQAQPHAQPESYQNVPGSLSPRSPDQHPDPWAGMRQTTGNPTLQQSGSGSGFIDKWKDFDKSDTGRWLGNLFQGWAQGNSVSDSLAKGGLSVAQGGRENQTIKYLTNNGYSQEDAQAINGNRDALNMALSNIFRKQNPSYALKTQATQLGMEKTQAEIDQMKNGQRGLINAGNGQIYNPNSGDWITAPNSGKAAVSVDGSNLDLNDLPAVELDENGVPSADQQKAFLSKLPPATAAQVQGIVDGRVDLTKSTSMKDGQRQAYSQLASMFDPNFDMSMGPLRAQTRKNYGPGGYMGKMADSTNLAIQHLNAMKQAYDKIGNGNWNSINSARNWWNGEGGNGPLAAFRAAQNGVAGELEKTFTGSNGTESGRSDWKDSFNENASPQQMHDAIETAMHMLSSRVETYNNGWDHAMRGKNQFPLLTPNSIKALKGMGFDTDTLEGRTAAAPSSPKPNGDGSVSINGYNIRKL
ncbi:hypothetical protein ACWF50_13140 [Brucella pseudogrignonensis]